MAARIRERALADTREHVNQLLKQLAHATAELRSNKTRIADLAAQIDDYRGQLSTVIARAVTRSRDASARVRSLSKTRSAAHRSKPLPLPRKKKRTKETRRKAR